MPRLVYLASAIRDLEEIAAYIEREAKSRTVAQGFIRKLHGYCEHVAALPGLLGRARPELRPAYRSITHGSYVIFFRYLDGERPRAIFEIIHVLHGARDIDAFFAAPDENP